MQSKRKLKILSEKQMAAAEKPLREAERSILMRHRKAPKRQPARNMTLRNYYQISTAESVYAVTRWNLVDGGQTVEGQLGGGTGWAVAMAILRRVPHVHLYDIERRHWYTYNYGTEKWEQVDTVPIPNKRYAGIGSRDLGEAGEEAIKQLFR